MLIDDLTIRVVSGKGGDGGSVYFESVSDLGALNRLRHRKVFEAKDGQNGKRQLNDGNRGQDLTINAPVGAVIHNLTTKSDREIVKIGERILAAEGGQDGKGNFHRAELGAYNIELQKINPNASLLSINEPATLTAVKKILNIYQTKERGIIDLIHFLQTIFIAFALMGIGHTLILILYNVNDKLT